MNIKVYTLFIYKMELTDELRYPTTRMHFFHINERSSYEELMDAAQTGILQWFNEQKKRPVGEEPVYRGSEVLGAAFHRGVAAMEKLHHLISHIKRGVCGPIHISLDHPRCREPGRPIYALYVATRNLDPYLKGLYRLDAFLEQIQQALWNDLHGLSSSSELFVKIETFAKTAIRCEEPREKNGELLYDWLETTLEWLAWIESF